MKNITILGVTGSIGKSTLSVIDDNSEDYSLYACAAYKDVDSMLKIIQKYNPKFVALYDEKSADMLQDAVNNLALKTKVLKGESGVIELASDSNSDEVISAIVGAAGLKPTLSAVRSGIKVGLANKESLVMSGKIFFEEVKKYNTTIIPIDSEHSAIFQSMPKELQETIGFCDLKKHNIKKILLTGSGGPFRDRDVNTLDFVTVDEAINHPVWSMGPKISVDSATMMNKGLEFIEARYLFNAKDEDIEIIVHPQSIIHSMVSYEDGAVIAQLGSPDMKTPISLALSYPQRLSIKVNELDFFKIAQLNFKKPDYNRYPCLKLAREASKLGQSATTALNAANEIAVSSFLHNNCKFTDISKICEIVVEKFMQKEVYCIDDVLDIDAKARQFALTIINNKQY